MSPPVQIRRNEGRWNDALRRTREDEDRKKTLPPPARVRTADRIAAESGPLAKPTRATADGARLRTLADPSSALLRERLLRDAPTGAPTGPAGAAPSAEAPTGSSGIMRPRNDPRRVTVDDLSDRFAEALGKKDPKKDPSLRTSRPAGEPFTPVPADVLAGVQANVDKTGDRSQLDQVDNFRQTLPPDQQAEYDRQLEALRNDDRIEFEYVDGAPQSDATEDLALRGILAATWGNPDSLERTIATSHEQSGSLKISVHDGPVPIGDYYEGNTDTAAGLATPTGGIAIDRNFMNDVTAKGDNPFVHEFAHIQQRTNPDGTPHMDQRFPADFPYPDALTEAYESPEFQQYIIDRFHGGNPPTDDDGNPVTANGGAETWPTLQNLFRQYPEELKAKSPEIYQQMVDYSGYDPMTRQQTPRVQLNGTGDPQAATGALAGDFDRFAGGDDRITTSDLEGVLHDPSSTAEQRAAAAFYLSNPTYLSALDLGAGRGRVDGKISREDVEGFEQQMGQAGWTGATDGVTGTVNTQAEADAVMARYAALADSAAGRGGRDGNVSDDDLRALIAAPGIPEELRAAARWMLENG